MTTGSQRGDGLWGRGGQTSLSSSDHGLLPPLKFLKTFLMIRRLGLGISGQMGLWLIKALDAMSQDENDVRSLAAIAG